VSSPLPVHGFVLAGGKSLRMGQDKATMHFRGRPLVEIAVEKLRNICATVSIGGNRADLAAYAPIAPESRLDQGPAAGVQACLAVSAEPWAMFVPVDVPLVPARLLRTWGEDVLRREHLGCCVSYLEVDGQRQPAFCMLKKMVVPRVTQALDDGERRLTAILRHAALGESGLWVCDVAALPGIKSAISMAFSNVNSPREFAAAEALAATAASNQESV
jgi:molybdopterin-guanine dinucleotide biosynthesis protein A